MKQGELFAQEVTRISSVRDSHDLKRDLEKFKIIRPNDLRGPFGVTQRALTGMNYQVLEDVFYGMHNVNVPSEMLYVENGNEIIANLLATGRLKRFNGHLKNGNIPRDFLNLIAYMNRVAFDDKSFRRTSPSFGKRFESSNGKQGGRLELLDPEVGEAFVESFFRRYVPSSREEPENGDAFYDPNSDASSKKTYAQRIYRFLKRKEDALNI